MEQKFLIPAFRAGNEINCNGVKYIVKSLLGCGAYSRAYEVKLGNKKMAIKVEDKRSTCLLYEVLFYKQLQLPALLEEIRIHNRYLAIPSYIDNGIGDSFRYLVLPMFKGNLDSRGKKFSLQTTLLIAIRMIEALRFVHKYGCVHADIKGSNILVNNNKVYLADFGLVEKYTNGDTHIEYSEDPELLHNGTLEFTSIDAHRGARPSRRGDMQILGYNIIHWLNSKHLPWFVGETPESTATIKMVYKDKMHTLLKTEDGIKKFLIDVFQLSYDEQPDYERLIDYLKSDLEIEDPGYVIF
jgi:vaccinia related kinase